MLSTGCATLIKGTSKNVVFLVYPEDGTVYYQGRPVRDGDSVTVNKSLRSENQVNVGTRERPINMELKRDLEPWFIGSCALVLLFVIPGVVAIAVDLITGAALDPHTTQNFNVVVPRDGRD